jgi:hypothetical protein
MLRVKQLLSALEQAQFPFMDGLIHPFVGGSELHGAKVKDTDDLDIYGVYLEPRGLFLGWTNKTFTLGARRAMNVETAPTISTSAFTPFENGRG